MIEAPPLWAIVFTAFNAAERMLAMGPSKFPHHLPRGTECSQSASSARTAATNASGWPSRTKQAMERRALALSTVSFRRPGAPRD
jgi:hypothetical protein